ncbi:helix-turn-helix domain-containing protein [Prochlorococcus marinus]|uniref:DNA-binding protein n=1 Tax=Prochlorococcus marinus XMU1408 TaxID=2213228 RepID=A0A318R3V6_PROMR|nr:helix-turn-helix domain-containing protein [Prochlorococcus marinus]MBW3042275.1 DNA-binding protein [Prochlorococcus marinus str. XMU1408]PYE01663.1 DNA-binding protein [Prochlorococcus marinus XMU1408]
MALTFPFKKKSSNLSNLHDEPDPDYDFLKAINLFKSQRKKFEVSLEELSEKTKISKNVLIAIENGWKKYLPEATYLISMIKKLEIELKLEKGSLNGLLNQKVTVNSLSKFKFNFINIDFLNSWVGSLLYIITMLLSIFAINFQQEYLLKIHSISTEPIILNDPEKPNEDINQ